MIWRYKLIMPPASSARGKQMILASRRNSDGLVWKIDVFSVCFRRIAAVSKQILHLPLVKKSTLVKAQTFRTELGTVVDSRTSVTWQTYSSRKRTRNATAGFIQQTFVTATEKNTLIMKWKEREINEWFESLLRILFCEIKSFRDD